ncbi:tyrosyl-DNA phosphodiesterase 1, partial [Podila verticillata]
SSSDEDEGRLESSVTVEERSLPLLEQDDQGKQTNRKHSRTPEDSDTSLLADSGKRLRESDPIRYVNLELMVQINYMIDVEFVMNRIPEEIRDGLKVIVYHGLRLTPDQLLFVVHTANMIERDWRNKTQAIFTTGRLVKKPQLIGLATCAFERDLLEYMSKYSHHQEISARISQYDFTGVKGVLVGSVPGRFSGVEKNKWGHMRLRSVLRQQVEISKACIVNSKIICQISSVGSLGKNSQDWLRGEFEMSLNAHRQSNYMASSKADLCVVFPTAENVRTSYEGWSMGGSLPFKETSYTKQAHYLNPLLHSWQAAKSGRDHAMPHIKTFTRVSCMEEADVISWFLLTSANLSKPAWGVLKDGAISIQSYELGVLVFPSLFEVRGPGFLWRN